MPNKELITQFITTSGKIKRVLQQLTHDSYEEKVATVLQHHALNYLSENPKSSVGELANQLILSSGAIAQLTDRLVNYGWIKREDDPKDRRIILLSLTNEGTQKLKEMRKNFLEKIEKLLANISEDDLRTLVKIQNNLLENLEKNSKNND